MMDFLPNQSPVWQSVFDDNPRDDLIPRSYNAPYPTPDHVLQDIQTALKGATQTYEHVEVLLCRLRTSDPSVLLERNHSPADIPQIEEQRLQQRFERLRWHVTRLVVRLGHEFPRRFSKHLEDIAGNLGKNDVFIVYYTDSERILY